MIVKARARTPRGECVASKSLICNRFKWCSSAHRMKKQRTTGGQYEKDRRSRERINDNTMIDCRWVACGLLDSRSPFFLNKRFIQLMLALSNETVYFRYSSPDCFSVNYSFDRRVMYFSNLLCVLLYQKSEIKCYRVFLKVRYLPITAFYSSFYDCVPFRGSQYKQRLDV